jgi:hypothetical protein
MACAQAHLLRETSQEPTCPSCAAVWSYEFIVDTFPAAFRNGAFKRHREQVLLDRERARLPETQQAAVVYKEARTVLAPMMERVAVLRARAYESPLRRAILNIKDDIANTGEIRDREDRRIRYRELYVDLLDAKTAWKLHFADELSELARLSRQTFNLRQICESYGQTGVGIAGGAGAVAKPPARYAYKYKCPAASCVGFLKDWTCEMCNTAVCKHCRECVDASGEHECDPDTVASVKAIAEESRPCPKCATQISRISGCDQMWCTQCNTAFDWKTGAIETRVIHNPHYFQWLRERGTAAVAAGGAGAVACEERGVERVIAAIVAGGVRHNMAKREALDYCNHIQHLRGAVTHSLTYDLRVLESDRWRHALRVQRLVGEIDDAAWKKTLQKKEKAFHRTRTLDQLCTMYINASTDILQAITRESTTAEYDAVLAQLRTLTEYVSVQHEKIKHAYKTVGCPDLVSATAALAS